MTSRSRWKTIAAASLLVATAACSSGKSDKDAGTQAAQAGPKIATEATFDFGKVRQGMPVEHVFKIRNEGDAELRIDNAHGS